MGSNQSAHSSRYQMKTTSNGRCPSMEEDLKKWKVEILSNHWSDLTQIWYLSYLVKPECTFTKISNKNDLQWKTTSNGRKPQNIKSRISQQPLVGSYSNLKLKLLGSKHSANYKGIKWSNGRRPPTQYDLKISNHWSYLTQIEN